MSEFEHDQDGCEQAVRDALRAGADAGGAPDEAAAWSRIRSGVAVAQRSTTRRRRTVLGLSGLAIAGAAATVAIVLTTDGDDRESVEVVPADTTTTVEESTTTVPSTATTAANLGTVPDLSDGVPATLPEHPLIVATTSELQLWDGDGREQVAVLTTAGAGRAAAMAEGYRLGAVSLGPGAVWFTEYAGPEDQPSIWRLDLTTGEREQVVDFGALPAISPDGTKLAYLAGSDYLGGVAQTTVIRDLASGTERRIESFDMDPEFAGPSRLLHLEWSPDGSRLAFEDSYEESIVGVLDPATAASLSDAVFLDGGNRAPSWLDANTIISEHFCCYPEFEEERRFVRSNASTGAEVGTVEGIDGDVLDLAVGADGRVVYLEQSDPTQFVVGTLVLPGPGGAIEVLDVRSMDW